MLFAVLILVPAAGYRLLGWNAILSFWTAYVLTRPLGASFADWIGKPANLSGLGWGDGAAGPRAHLGHRRAGRLPGGDQAGRAAEKVSMQPGTGSGAP